MTVFTQKIKLRFFKKILTSLKKCGILITEREVIKMFGASFTALVITTMIVLTIIANAIK